MTRNSNSAFFGWSITAALLIIAGAKLLAIGLFGSNIPFWDQWDAEAFNLYVPYLNGTLTFADLIASHNEHRILFTRLLAVLELEANGARVPKLQ